MKFSKCEASAVSSRERGKGNKEEAGARVAFLTRKWGQVPFPWKVSARDRGKKNRGQSRISRCFEIRHPQIAERHARCFGVEALSLPAEAPRPHP